MRKCDEIRKLLPVYLDNELESVVNKEVKGHLISCAACQKELEAHKKIWEALGKIEDIEPTPGYISQFWTELTSRKSWTERVFGFLKEVVFKKRFVPVLAGACVFVFAGLFAVRNYYQIESTHEMIFSLISVEMEMIEQIELVENFDLIQDMEFFEDMEVIEHLDELETS